MALVWQACANELLGRIQYARNDPVGAVEFWQRALEHESELRGPTGEGLSPLSPRVIRKDLARALLRARRPAEARGQLQKILAGGPDAEASWLLSRAFLQEGAVAKALGAFKEAVSFADENPVLADPAPFVGSASCAGCHSEQFQTQQSSRRARTFHRVSELRDFVPPRPALPDPVDARITHTLRKAGDRLEQETQTPERLYQAVVDYAFGSGDRSKTLVGHDPFHSGSSRAFHFRNSRQDNHWLNVKLVGTWSNRAAIGMSCEPRSRPLSASRSRATAKGFAPAQANRGSSRHASSCRARGQAQEPLNSQPDVWGAHQ